MRSEDDVLERSSRAGYLSIKVLNKLFSDSESCEIIGNLQNSFDEDLVDFLPGNQAFDRYTLPGNVKLLKFILEAKNIKNNYGKVIVNFNDLCDEFSFDDARYIERLYEFMAHNGYLSVNKKISKVHKYDYTLYRGTGVIAGNAVCKNHSCMMDDILRNRGIKSNVALCSQNNYGISLSDGGDSSYSELASKICSSFYYNDDKVQLFKLLNENNDYVNALYYDFDELNFDTFNHAICVCEQDDKYYAMDPHNQMIFKRTSDPSVLVSGKAKGLAIHPSNDEEVFTMLSKDSTTLLEDEDARDKATDIILDNIDLLDDFYQENCDTYKKIYKKIKPYCADFKDYSIKRKI